VSSIPDDLVQFALKELRDLKKELEKSKNQKNFNQEIIVKIFIKIRPG
jgi:hypothetical protein